MFAVDDEDDDDDGEDDEDDDLPSWSNLETVNSCHPLYFARMIVEVYDWNLVYVSCIFIFFANIYGLIFIPRLQPNLT